MALVIRDEITYAAHVQVGYSDLSQFEYVQIGPPKGRTSQNVDKKLVASLGSRLNNTNNNNNNEEPTSEKRTN